MPNLRRERQVIWLIILLLTISCFAGPAREQFAFVVIPIIVGLGATSLWWLVFGRNR